MICNPKDLTVPRIKRFKIAVIVDNGKRNEDEKTTIDTKIKYGEKGYNLIQKKLEWYKNQFFFIIFQLI